jgi:hypothetical protein
LGNAPKEKDSTISQGMSTTRDLIAQNSNAENVVNRNDSVLLASEIPMPQTNSASLTPGSA